MAVRINLEGAVRYLNAVPVGKLDGLQQELVAKANELSIAPGKVITPETQVGQEPTGNVAGILRFVGSVNAESTDQDKAALATLLAVVTARTGAQGLKVGATADAPAPVGPRGRRRRRRQG